MALVTSFEEIYSWKKARILNKYIYEETNKALFRYDFALKNQIRKASISTMSNIAEGFERNNNKEFRYFMNVAKGSNGEVRSQLYIAYDLGYLDEEFFNKCLKLTTDIGNLIGAFIESLNELVLKEQQKKSNTNEKPSNSSLFTRHS